jgi:hypothetical protein
VRDDRCGRAAELERTTAAGEPDRRAVAMSCNSGTLLRSAPR